LAFRACKEHRALLDEMDSRAFKVLKVYMVVKVYKVYEVLGLYGKVFGVTKLNMPLTILYFIMGNLG
jgi:hypothetical protein